MSVLDLTAGLLVSRYHLEQCLGVGACGEVWRASDGLRQVAIKFINANLLTDSEVARHQARLRSEIEALQRCSEHPHVPQIYEYDLSFERPYLVMQFIDKPPLRRLITNGEILCVTLKQRLQLLRTIAQTLRAVHVAGILHRDIKPNNIHGVNHPYLLDFSVALDKQLASTASRRVGTRLYMAPDDGQPPDERDDTYSLALVAYEILFGCHAFFTPEMVHGFRQGAWPNTDDCLRTGAWFAPTRLTEQELPRALFGANLAVMEKVFVKALGKRAGRYYDPTRLAQDLLETVLVPANEAYLDYVPDVATTLSLQFSIEDDFTVDQVDLAAYATDHHGPPVLARTPVRRWMIMAALLVLVVIVVPLLVRLAG